MVEIIIRKFVFLSLKKIIRKVKMKFIKINENI